MAAALDSHCARSVRATAFVGQGCAGFVGTGRVLPGFRRCSCRSLCTESQILGFGLDGMVQWVAEK